MRQAPITRNNSWADLLSEGRLPKFALICLGVWLNAADTLVTATIMPSVGADLSGYAYFSWAVAGFLIGAILAGASAGRLSEIMGLRKATAFAGVVLAVGCLLSALAPGIGLFLAGRVIQGVGSGWISGFAMVAIALLFPERHIARVFAGVAAIWGVATVLGPLVGGLFAEAGDWRAVFWLFAAQAVLFSVASPILLVGSDTSRRASGIPWTQLAVLALGVGAISVANLTSPALAIALMAIGIGFLLLVLWVDHRAPVRMLPHRAGDLTTISGAGYAAMFALTAASMGLTIYGPAILQQLHGLTPLLAGYVVGSEALAWTLMAFVVAGVTTPDGERFWIRTGAGCILAGAVLLAVVMRQATIVWVVAGGGLMGAGFGFSSSLMNRRVLRALSEPDRAIGASAFIAVRQAGSAAGAAIAGVSANLAGFGAGLSASTAHAAGVWVFVTAIPLALAGVWAAWRLSGSAATA
ncbi:MAG: MFS transporter [Alphaproteobacteria bacterium]|nr:MFS transporter [Alphaproteobacteria bacterium]